MAGFDYISAQKTSDRLIKQFGFQLPVLKTVTTFDPVLGKNAIASIQVSTNYAVSLPATSASVNGFDNNFREEVKKGKIRFLYISSKELPFELEAGDLAIFEKEAWHIAGATPLNPAGVSMYYTAGIKNGGLDFGSFFTVENLTEYETLLEKLNKGFSNNEINLLFNEFFIRVIPEINVGDTTPNFELVTDER